MKDQSNTAPREPANAMVWILIGGIMAVAALFAIGFNDVLTPHLQKVATAVAATQATPATWPCPLPALDGARSVAVLTKRGQVFDVTCRDLWPLVKPTAAKGAK